MRMVSFAKLMAAISAAALLIGLQSPAQAISVFEWDPQVSGGTALGGPGTWNAANTNWYVNPADQAWLANSNAAFAGAAGGAVSLAFTTTANTLSFNTTGYTISGSNPLTLSGGGITVSPGDSATIGSPVTIPSTTNLSVSGGTLALTGALTTAAGASSTINVVSGNLVIGQTNTINLPNGGTINGNLVITNSIRVNFNSQTGSTSAPLPSVAAYSGNGAIQVQSPSSILSNTSGTFGGQINMTGGIQLNSLNLLFNKFDVTAGTPAYPATNAFSVAIGATKNGSLNGYLQVNSPISGNSDVVFTSNSTVGGGAGVTLLNAQCSYAGTTLIEGNGGVTAGYNGGSLILGVSNALPAATDVEFGDLNGKPSHNPEIDVNGFNQQIGSLSSNAASATYSTSDTFYVANNGTGTATLTVSGNTTPANAYGGLLVDSTTGGSGSLALLKDGSNTLKLTGTANTYSGGTTLNGGALDASNAAGSATGTGPVTLNGGLLESDSGTIAGPVIAGSGAHAIAPGGLGAIGTLVLESSLSLNGNSTLDFDVSGGSADLLQISSMLSDSSPANVAISATGPFSGTYTLATFALSSINNGDFNVTGVPAGYQFEANATSIVLAPIPTPEPSTLAMLAIGAIGLLGYARRRRAS